MGPKIGFQRMNEKFEALLNNKSDVANSVKEALLLTEAVGDEKEKG